MCTVTFFNFGDRVVLTSNRDEHIRRAHAQFPFERQSVYGKITGAKDSEAGGSWFYASQNGQIMILLNGAELPHQADPPYSKSRGIVLMELMNAENAGDSFKAVTLERIEPFTIVYFHNNQLSLLRWNGKNKSIEKVNQQEPSIWSSSTLYYGEREKERSSDFKSWVKTSSAINESLILDAHAGLFRLHPGTLSTDSPICTVSITQMVLTRTSIDMSYYALPELTPVRSSLQLSTP